jgi:predicted nuclease of predicted toxin-antitoxin system
LRLLLDSCVSGLVRDALARAGHDVSWAGDWPRDPGDEEILARAHAEKRVLVTLDKDFGELAVVRGLPHAGIVRLVDLSLKVQANSCLRVLELHGPEIERGAIATAEPGRLRVRPAEET